MCFCKNNLRTYTKHLSNWIYYYLVSQGSLVYICGHGNLKGNDLHKRTRTMQDFELRNKNIMEDIKGKHHFNFPPKNTAHVP